MEKLSIQSHSSEQLTDYFLVCGVSDEPKDYDVSEVLLNGEEIVHSDTRSLDFSRYPRPIVDVKIVNRHEKEMLPYGYTELTHTYTNAASAGLHGRSTDELYVCYRRGFDKVPISDIGIAPETRVKKTCTLIDKTVEGRPAALIKTRLTMSSVYLSYNRVPSTYGVDQLALTELCFIMKSKGEVCPMGYMECSQKLSGSQYGSEVYLCYKKSLIKPHIATFQPEVLTWYDDTQSSALEEHDGEEMVSSESNHLPKSASQVIQYSESPTPPAFNSVDIRELANFCLPWGAAIESWSINQSPPKPCFFSFVVTNASYQKLHGSALTFYEPFDASKVTKDLCYRLNLEPEIIFATPKEREQHENELFTSPEELATVESRLKAFRRGRVGDRVLGVTKTICLLSRSSFGNAFKPFLQFLCSRCFADTEEDNVKLKIPLERYLSFFLNELPFPYPRSPKFAVDLDGYYLQLIPPEDQSPLSGVSICELILLVGSELCLQLMVQLLTEQKLLLISVRPDILAQSIQALVSIIHPLRWVLVYIPFIHMRCIHVVQSPSPFIIGVDSRFFEFFRLPGCEGISCVDLDTRNFHPAKSNPFCDTKCLPKGPVKKLRNTLLIQEAELIKIHNRLHEQALAGIKWDPAIGEQSAQIGKKLRTAFMTFMADLLQNYRQFLLPIGSSNTELLFDVDGFTKSTPDNNSRPFYRALCGTQLWADFVRDLTYISERNGDLEVFDRYIAEQDEHMGYDSGSSIVSGDSGSGSGSQGFRVLPHINGGTPASVKGSSGTPERTNSLVQTSTANSLLGFHPSTSFKMIPTPSLEGDNDDLEFDKEDYTWTQWGSFPASLNQKLLQKLRHRFFQHNLAVNHSSSSSSLTSLLHFRRAPSMQVCTAAAGTNQNASTLSLYSEFNAHLLASSGGTDALASTAGAEEFSPKMEFLRKPPAFSPGNGVAAVFGVGKLNALLRRTQQEVTDSLIFAGKCRQYGGFAWANLLLSEVYSLWFILLPSFLISLHHLKTQSLLDAATPTVPVPSAHQTALCPESQHLLVQSIGLFRRLHQLPLHFTDQVSERVLVALLYEYGLSDKEVTNFWQSCGLNAVAYAMANQLQRDLGFKLAASEKEKTSEKSPKDETLLDGIALRRETSVNEPQTPIDDQPTPRASAVSNGIIDHITAEEKAPREKRVNGGQGLPLIVGSFSSNDLCLQDSAEAQRIDSEAFPHSVENEEEAAVVKSLPSSKRNWRNITMKSIKSLASMSIRWEEPEIINLTTSKSSMILTTTIPNSRKSTNRHQSRLVGYGHNLDKSPRQTDDGFRESNLASPGSEYQGPPNNNSSWIQGLKSEFSRKLNSFSPAPQRHVRNASGDFVDWRTPRGSIIPAEDGGAGISTVPSTTIGGGSFDQFDGPPEYSWYEIAGSLAVGALSDRMCLANPLTLAADAAVQGGVSPRSRSSSYCPEQSNSRRHVRRNSGFSSLSFSLSPIHNKVLGDSLDGTESNRKSISPAASSPVLPTVSRSGLPSPTDRAIACKPPLPSSSTFPRQRQLSASSASFSSPQSCRPRALELRVIMTTCNVCPGCLRTVYDEEVMTEWANCESNELAIHCPHCNQRHEFIPRLTVRTVAIGRSFGCVQTNESESPAIGRSSVPNLGPRRTAFSHGLIEYTMPYLNPFRLRKELESFFTHSSTSGAMLDCMAVEGLSSANLLSSGRHDTLLWNLVFFFHRVGLPTHLLDAYPAWLMDCQSEARRLGLNFSRRCLKGITMTKALSEVILSPDLPVWLVAKWDMFPRKGMLSLPLYRHWTRLVGSGVEHVPMNNVESENRLKEIITCAGDALKFENTEGAFMAVLMHRKRDGCADDGLDHSENTKGSLSSLLHANSIFTPLPSLYRELFLLSICIHGGDYTKLNKFEDDYRKLYEDHLKSASEDLSQADAPPPLTTLACRTLFRSLTLS